jgi:signal transduction histidine kinase
MLPDIVTIARIVPLIISVVISLGLALLVYHNNPRSTTNRIFSALSILLTAWLVANYLSVDPAFFSYSLFFIRTSIVLATPVSALFFLLAHTLPQKQLSLSLAPQLGIIGLILATMALAASPYAISGVTIIDGTPHPITEPGMGVFGLVSTIFSVGAIITLFKKFKNTQGTQKAQIRYVLAGILLMLGLLIVSVLLPLLLFQTSLFVPIIPLYTLSFLGMTTIAIVRQRLMDIRMLVGRTASFAILILLFAAAYATTLFVIGNSLARVNLPIEQLGIFTIITIIASISFHPIQRNIERITDRLFYKNRYDSDMVLLSLSKIMAFTLRLDDLTHQILKELIKEVKITKAAFILLEEDRIVDVRSEGYHSPPSFDEIDIKLIKDTRNMVIFEELEEGKLKDVMRMYGISVAAHLRTEGKQVGLLILGQKSSGDIYADQDITLLDILTPEVAVAIENALSYEEIRRFNITLQEEVNRATTDLQKANTQLEVLDKLKDEFVSVASHELRTPMTAIKSYTWLVLNGKAGTLEPKAKEYINRVYLSTERLIHLVNEMLDVSRIESGRVKLTLKLFDPIALVTDIQNEFAARATEAGVKVMIEKQDHIPQLTADSEKIQQVLENLVGNALKFTPKDGAITMRLSTTGNTVTFAVSDTGAGISEEDMAKLFKKFGRLENSLVAMKSNSTGLGLYISKQYVELHGGTIHAQSTVGKGSTFTFVLPLKPPATTPVA